MSYPPVPISLTEPCRCLMLGSPQGDAALETGLQSAWTRAGCSVATAGEGAAQGQARYDLAFATAPGRVPAQEFLRLKREGCLIGGMAVGELTPDAVAAVDVFFCLDPHAVSTLRKMGKTAYLLQSGPDRAEACRAALDRHLRYRKQRFGQVDWSRISYGHTEISRDQVSEAMTTAWQSEEIPARQRALVQTELEQMYRGNVPKVYQVLVGAVASCIGPAAGDAAGKPRILEIGCASGYYSEILEYQLNRALAYTGVDYSEPLIRMARSLYPDKDFRVADGAALPFADGEFPVAISSCVLLHVPNYREHIRETARVAGRSVIAHRTPVCRRRPTEFQRKYAYGVETVELLFNEAEILECFRSAGLALVAADEFSSEPAKDEYCVTYVFRKAEVPAGGPKDGNGVDDLLAQGEAAFSKGDLAGAKALFLRARGVDPRNARLLNDLGVLACEEGDLAGAKDWFHRAYRGEPGNAKYLANLVKFLQAVDDAAAARTLLAAHLAARPGDAEAGALLAGLPPA